MGCNTTYLGTSKYLAKLRHARDRDDVTIGELVDSKFRNISETHKAQDDNGRLFLQHECSKNGKQKFFLSLARMRMWRSYICRSDTAYALRRKFNEAEIL